jgi:hypothetical protein
MANCIAWPRYDEDEEVWVAKESQLGARQAEKVFRAISHASKKSLMLGTSLWTIYNDTKACSPNGTYSAWLTMTACNDTEYTCASGNCVPMEQRCDGKRQCADGTDEQNCKIVTPAVGYDMFLTPPPINPKYEFLEVNMTLNILDIIDIDQVKGLFNTKVSVRTLWHDSGLTYNNLKSESKRNKLNKESKFLWSPVVIYEPVINKDRVKEMLDYSDWKIIATNISDYTPAGQTSNNNGYKYSGATNLQDLTTQESVEWVCNFQLFWYPFDTQTCRLKFYIQQDWANLYPEKMIYSGPLELIQFNIQSYNICSIQIGDKVGVEATMVFGRPLVSNILTVFIPTLILLVISHVANSFDKDYIDMVIGVNLTVLLVLASL